MNGRKYLLLGAVALAAAQPAFAREVRTGPDSGLPVPRYESLASGEVFGRRGPGASHPIDWIYRRRGLPVQILEESDVWRKIRDPERGETWMHSIKLSPVRTAIVRGGPDGRDAALRREASPNGAVTAIVEKGVIGRLLACEGQWRKVQIGRIRGWIEANALWAGEDCTELAEAPQG